MPKFREASVDEYLSRRQPVTRDGIVYRAAGAPKTFNAEERSQVFVMTDESVDSYGDIVKSAGADLYRFEKNPIALLNHRSDMILGTWSEVQKKPQRVEGKVTLAREGTAPHIDMAYNLMGQGILRGASIGFLPSKLEMRLDDDGEPTWSYIINEFELFECSVVSIPANASALARSAANSDDLRICRDYIEQVLDSWVKSPEGLLLPRSEYEKAYTVVVEKIAADVVINAAAEDAEDLAAPEPEVVDQAAKVAADVNAARPQSSIGKPSDEVLKAFADTLAGLDPATAVLTVLNGPNPKIKIADKELLLPLDMNLDEVRQAINQIRWHASVAITARENKTETNVVPKPLIVTLEADTSALEAAAEKVDGIFSKLAKKFPMFFAKGVEPERVEPTIVPATPPAPPTEEEKAAALAKFAALRTRLVSKELIAA